MPSQFGGQPVTPSVAGLLEPGNIDLSARPVVKNKDGTISTVRSMSANFDGREVLIPTVSDDGRIMSDDEAIQTYRQTGRHLGKFASPDAANIYAQSLHEQQASQYAGAGSQFGGVPIQQASAPKLDRVSAEKLVADLEATEGRPFAPESREQIIADAMAHGFHIAVPKEGQQQFGPGPGRPALDENGAREFAGEGQPTPLKDLTEGGLHGLASTGAGVAQLSAHVNPAVRIVDMLASLTGQPLMRDRADQFAAEQQQRWEGSPASQTAAGGTGQFLGGVLATSPIAAIAVPAKGVTLGSALTRSAAGGGAIAATQPVNGENFVNEKLSQVALGGTLGAGVTGAGRSAMALGERAFGPNYLAQLANLANGRANRTQFADESEALAQRTGIPFTPGMVSGSKMQTGVENMARQSVFSADQAFAADKRIADKAVQYIDGMMDRISANPASEAAIGTQIQSVTRGAVEKIAAQREKVASQQYGAIDAALKGRPFVQPSNALREADAIIAEYGSVAGPEAARIVKQAEALKAQLQGKQAYTFREAQMSRAYYGRGARGASNVFDDVNPDINRRIATRLFKAFDADMEQSAQKLSGTGPGLVPSGTVGLAEAIKQANANYKRYSQLIEATKAHPIARLFGENINIDDVVTFDKIAPETVIKRLGTMQPTELEAVRNFMQNNAPEAWQQYKRLLVDRALGQAQTLPTSAGANVVPFNASSFLRAMGGDKPDKIAQLRAIYSPAEIREIDDAFAAMRRMGDKFGTNFSGTGPYMEVNNLLQSIRARGAQGIASSAGEVMGLRKVANVMLNADGRKKLIELSKLPPQSRQAASLVAFLSALIAGQQTGQSGQPQRQKEKHY